MAKSDISDWRPGILPREYLEILQREGFLINCEKIGDSSIDLRLSQNGWEMLGSVKLTNDLSFPEINNDPKFQKTTIDLNEEVVLEVGRTYVIQLMESVKFRGKEFSIYGQATGKSSIGRLDVLTRLIVNNCNRFDTLPKDYDGSLYVEITPITFPIKVKNGVSLNQLRLFRGAPKISRLGQEEMAFIGATMNSDKEDISELTLNLKPDDIGNKKVIGIKAKKSEFSSDEALDLCPDAEDYKRIDPKKYWELILDNGDKFLKIEKDHFDLPPIKRTR